ncbi:MAG: integrase core domain-containing protein [Pseudolabrys sp.]
MFAILHAVGMFVADMFKSRWRLEAENLFLRHQLNIALRQAPPRLRLRGSDRALLVGMTKLWPSLLSVTQVVQPETILRWHRKGFKAFWCWKSRKRAGRPKIDRGLRDLIPRMSRENPLWGASRIHGELLMLGFEVAQSTVSKYIVRRQNPPSQSWKTFLRNHAGAIAAIDMCVVPTVTFDLLFAFLVLGHGRRQLLWFEVTRHPTAEWLARQITEAFPWRSAPTYLMRDNDRAYGHVFTRRLRAMGIRDRPISPQSPWQNGHAERLIGTLRRECLDQVVSFGEAHLRRIPLCLCGVLQSSAYALGITERRALASSRPTLWRHCRRSDLGWPASPIRPDMIFGKDNYNDVRTHRSLGKDAPVSRPVERIGSINAHAILGGLHHHYVRV